MLTGLADGVEVSAVFDIERCASGAELRYNEEWDGARCESTWAAVFDDDLFESLTTKPTVN